MARPFVLHGLPERRNSLTCYGTKNPLTEWQREGFEMFETMMDSVSEDFVKYVSHIEISDNPKTDNEKTLSTNLKMCSTRVQTK